MSTFWPVGERAAKKGAAALMEAEEEQVETGSERKRERQGDVSVYIFVYMYEICTYAKICL